MVRVTRMLERYTFRHRLENSRPCSYAKRNVQLIRSARVSRTLRVDGAASLARSAGKRHLKGRRCL